MIIIPVYTVLYWDFTISHLIGQIKGAIVGVKPLSPNIGLIIVILARFKIHLSLYPLSSVELSITIIIL